ncbi:MAG: extracellular solute-binding protein [Phycisphaeraceae bacterium]|nr:extracellular solute-binding protein [Phycisphaerae bacterium]MBX3392804.1 extracellular solute-binding protein [Phycisphaeraceae bacterium]
MNTRSSTLTIFSLLGLILGVPFLLRPPASARETLPTDRTLIIITPHVQQISREFGPAFERWHQRTYGQTIRIDWRGPIGTSDLLKLLRAQYTAAIVAGDILPDGSCRPGVMTFDLLFGGGSSDHGRVKDGVTVALGMGEDGSPRSARIPMSVPAGFDTAQLDEWFGKNQIGTQRLYDPDQHWIGSALSAFGIVYNRDVYERLGLPPPRRFADLCDPRLAGWVALADPRQSGSIATSFDAILNNELWTIAREEGWSRELDEAIEAEARDRGRHWVKALWEARGESIQRAWDRGWRILREMCANTRYFTSSSTKPPIDVSQGDAAAGLAIDFYGRGQSQFVLRPGQDPEQGRVGYVNPRGETYIDADPISILRGGPNPTLARRFVEFCLTEEGQALWEFPPLGDRADGSDESTYGPVRFSLRRMPVRRVMYEKHLDRFVDKDLAPYDEASDTKPARWREAIGVMMGAFAIDVGDLQREAWKALGRARAAAAVNPALSPTVARMEALFYAWPDHAMPMADGRTLAFTPRNLPEIISSWQSRDDPTYMARCRIAYTEFNRRNYRTIIAIASDAGV